MRSTSGTSNTDKPLTKSRKSSQVEDICRIIEVSARAGVAKLKFGDVEVEFTPIAPDLGYHAKVDPSQYITSEMATPDSEQKSGMTISDRELLEDMRRSQLMIDDPMAFEQEMIDLQLTHGERADAQIQN